MWLKSANSEIWLDRRTTFTKTLAMMSMVGYILGLGDRHPNNLMLNRNSGKVIHIDFGDCFEVAMLREKFAEKVPFRLTRMLVNAMEVCGIRGTFKCTCQNVMRVLRENKESIMAVLEALVYDPLINWGLVKNPSPSPDKENQQGLLLENQNSRKPESANGPQVKAGDFDAHSSDESGEQFPRGGDDEIDDDLARGGLPPGPDKFFGKRDNEFEPAPDDDDNMENTKTGNFLNRPDDKDDGSPNDDSVSPTDVSNANDNEMDTGGDTNQKAVSVLERVSNKLSGRDFPRKGILDVKKQVNLLIEQAMSCELLAQAYLGWCPYW